MDRITIVDFGGQYAHLIASRIRRAGVYADIVHSEDATAKQLGDKEVKGIILSGGPDSTLRKGAPTIDPKVLELGKPILAICYGHQLLMKLLGGTVKKGKVPEYGPAQLTLKGANPLFKGLKKTSTVWMSHWDEVTKLPKNFAQVGESASCGFAAAADMERQMYGVQFHPEVTHTEIGEKLLGNFIGITGAIPSWTMDRFLQDEIAALKKHVGKRKVFLLCSGGVDSTVAFALLEKALGKKRVYGLLVDHGLMRKDEATWVQEKLNKAGFDNLHVADEQAHFLAALKNAKDPEDKRRIIGRVFLKVQRKTLKKMNFNPRQWLLGQGTIYPDTIESGGTKNADKIKTHHNRVPEVEAMIKKGLVVEPLKELYKDEVRAVGRKLGLPAELVDRHPFPGPGLGVRVLCADEIDKPSNTSRIEGEIRRKWKVEGKILPIKSVGVQGDARTYRHAVAIFTKTRDWKKLDTLATEIIQKFPEVNRVVLSLNNDKAPRMFRVKAGGMTAERISLLQEADATAMDILKKKKQMDVVWQMPTVLVPIFAGKEEAESVVLRPVESIDAMTAGFSKLPKTVVDEFAKKLGAIAGLDHIFYDLTNKPPGTIEWE